MYEKAVSDAGVRGQSHAQVKNTSLPTFLSHASPGHSFRNAWALLTSKAPLFSPIDFGLNAQTKTPVLSELCRAREISGGKKEPLRTFLAGERVLVLVEV